MTEKPPEFPDDEARRLQAEIDRIRAGLEWLRLGRVERGLRGSAAEGESDRDASGPDDFRALTERMQLFVRRSGAHAGHFERMMAPEPAAAFATLAEVQQMLAATLAARRPQAKTPGSAAKGPGLKDPAVKRLRKRRRSV